MRSSPGQMGQRLWEVYYISYYTYVIQIYKSGTPKKIVVGVPLLYFHYLTIFPLFREQKTRLDERDTSFGSHLGLANETHLNTHRKKRQKKSQRGLFGLRMRRTYIMNIYHIYKIIILHVYNYYIHICVIITLSLRMGPTTCEMQCSSSCPERRKKTEGKKNGNHHMRDTVLVIMRPSEAKTDETKKQMEPTTCEIQCS